MTPEDLALHQSTWVQPISLDYRGVQVHELPPNGQGIVALIALGVLRYHNLSDYPVDSAESVHVQIEAMKIAFSEAHRHIADPDHMAREVTDFLDDGFLHERSKEIRMDRAAHHSSGTPGGGGTVYVSAADEGGMMVSFIQSNYYGFGSGIVIPGTGISMQNRGYGFVLRGDHPNCVAGGKRPYHTIIPAMVTRDGRGAMSFGVMGAHMQPQGHVQMMTRILAYHQNPQSACDAPRWCVTEDFSIAFEPGFPPEVAENLRKRGHLCLENMPVPLFGGAQIIYRGEGGYFAASDGRKDGQAVGY
jgi:gamma-glutamyltranspeptidase/glutathione hydrolase